MSRPAAKSRSGSANTQFRNNLVIPARSGIMLRAYQNEAVEAAYQYLRDRDDNPVLVLPTGAGKSWCIAKIATDAVTQWHGRVLVLAHRKELIEQNAEKIRRLCPGLSVGIYSAGLNCRDMNTPVLVAGIQSIHKLACQLGPFDLVVVDECQLIAVSGEGMYRRFLRDAKVINPHLRVIGLTATPYRVDSGPICSPNHFLNAVCYEVGIRELIRDGFLSPLISKAGKTRVDTDSLRIRGGEFVAEEVEQLMDDDQLVQAACKEILSLTADRKSVLIFTSGVHHGQHVQAVLQKHGAECGFVCGDTPSRERNEILARFRGTEQQSLLKTPSLKYLANSDLLTIGFDSPRIDSVVLLRPTMSPGLYSQMVGRGFRLAPGKSDCLILDFGGNIIRHGPVDAISAIAKEVTNGKAPIKECPNCQAVVLAGYSQCPQCAYIFPPPEKQKHEHKASEAGILTGQHTDERHEVLDVLYRVHSKKDAPAHAPRSLRVDYQLGLDYWHSEYVCLEHTGFARQKAEEWWQARSPISVPATADEANQLARCGQLRPTHAIVIRRIAGERFSRIIKYELGEFPDEPLEESAAYSGLDDDVPF